MAHGLSLRFKELKVVPKILSVHEGPNRSQRRGSKYRNLKKQFHLTKEMVIMSLKASI